MMAILHGKAKDGPRGRPPKSVAAKYTDPGKDAPESSGENRGGNWNEEHHAKAKERTKAARKEKKKGKKELRKALEDFYKATKSGAAATLVMDNNNRILLGQHWGDKNSLAFPGGHLEPNEDSAIGALRELQEETGLIGHNPQKIMEHRDSGRDVTVYLIESFRGKPASSKELTNLKWYEPQDIEWNKVRNCCIAPLKYVVEQKLGKSIKGMLAIEKLEKNIIRQRGDAVFEVTHGDALKLVGNGVFRMLREAVRDMKDEDFKDVHIDTYTISIRRHMSDVYSGRVSDGHKVVFQFTNKSLPELTAGLMSVFEWYLPEDQKELELLDEGLLQDDAIHGGINELVDNYRRHNIGNIYEEMETIREHMRNGMAIDLQQTETKIMTLFDKLEDVVHDVVGKHNMLAEEAGKEIEELERKLRELQSKIEEMDKKPEVVEAYSSNPANKDKIIDEYYSYLPKPSIEISPNGKIRISFGSDWNTLEKENFLKDMRARVIKKASK